VFNIPVIEIDSPYINPPYLSFVAGLLRRDKRVHGENSIAIDRFRPNLLRLLGVRFIIDEAPNISATLIKKILSEKGGKELYLYDLGYSNIGQYSPTNAIYGENVDEILSLLDQDNFNFEESFVTSIELNKNLTPATYSYLSFDKNGFLLEASSSGQSVLILPIQYSSCLNWSNTHPIQKSVRIFQANLMQVGFLFKGKISGHISYRFGPLSSNTCRLKDLRDFKTQLKAKRISLRSQD
jgi:hypothetical protein